MTTSNNFYINSTISDGDIVFQGVDGGNGITALTLDMSEGGIATFGSHIELQDNKELRVGNSHDLKIYHDDGGYNQIVAENDHPIQIKTASENMIKAIPNGAVELYHNNSKKFETTSSGVTVTGTVAATSYTGDGSNLTGISAGGMVLLNRSDVANSSQYVFTGFNSSLYDAYIVDWHGIQIASGGSPWVMYFSGNSGSSYHSNLKSIIHKAKLQNVSSSRTDTWSNGYAELAGSIGGTGDGVGTCGSGTVKIMNVNVGNDRGFQAHYASAYINYSVNRVIANGAVMADQSGNTSQPDCNAIKMKFYNGTNINKGTISVFGVIKA